MNTELLPRVNYALAGLESGTGGEPVPVETEPTEEELDFGEGHTQDQIDYCEKAVFWGFIAIAAVFAAVALYEVLKLKP